MPKEGWDRLLEKLPRRIGPIAAYSEFMPSPRVAWRPYDSTLAAELVRGGLHGWLISEREQEYELRPGLERIAAEVIHALEHLHTDQTARGLSRSKLEGNPFWPAQLARMKKPVSHEHYVLLMPLALSRTQDDKGRVRWTLFGGSEQGPARAFWKSFFTAPGRERLPEYGVDFIRRLLHSAYGESPSRLANLRRAGFRILPDGGETVSPLWNTGPLPSWTSAFLMEEEESLSEVRYILTFRPFSTLSSQVREAYLGGKVHLLPFPGSLLFWGTRPYLRLERELPLAMQIPLLSLFERSEELRGLRIPQSGWMHERRPGRYELDQHLHKMRNTYRRSHRWEHMERHTNELAVKKEEDRMAHVLFSCDPIDIDLYNKPMARNSQIWTSSYDLLLDGPRSGPKELARAAAALAEGGEFGYRFYFPPMSVGDYEIFWHLPLAAFRDPKTRAARTVEDGPQGYLTAYRIGADDRRSPVELWPQFRRRSELIAAMEGYKKAHDHRDHQFALNACALVDASEALGGAVLPSGFARSILNIARQESFEEWLAKSPQPKAPQGAPVRRLLSSLVAPPPDAASPLPVALTYRYSANRQFEQKYWDTILKLSTGRFLNKENADCVDDAPTRSLLKHKQRDLDALGDWLLAYYRRVISTSGMRSRALAGDLPFRWRTDFAFEWMKGWRANQQDIELERDLLVVIPGRNRARAVIMADHYDTAYMEDLYYKERGGTLARLASRGSDDNHSATAALMLGAPIFLELSRAGQLECDIWLVHLTGEEFPSDCMGARHLAQWLVEKTLRLRLGERKVADLSKVRVEGVYVLDMIAHNRHPGRDVFQISPGVNRKSFQLAYQAHMANRVWNAGAKEWNRRAERSARGRGRRSRDGMTIPALAKFPELRGEVRTPGDPRSSLFNTDGQIFSDLGIPVVLFMENYDINRVGYHDSKDNMTNIDLDYGAAVAAIAIESVARVAHDPDLSPPSM